MSNNNKMLINNLSCCFVIRVIWIQDTVKWDIKYIDEGFMLDPVYGNYNTKEKVNIVYSKLIKKY